MLLCFSGGGVRAFYEQILLQKLEERLGRPVHAYADCIAGFSGGAVALFSALLPGAQSLEKQMETAVKWAETAVPKERFFKKYWHFFKTLFRPYFGFSLLGDLLNAVTEGKSKAAPISDLLSDVYISAYNIKTETPVLFTRAGSPKTLALDALSGTCALPRAFSAHKNMVDGYIGCPDMPIKALMHVLRQFPEKKRWIVVLVDVLKGPDFLRMDLEGVGDFNLWNLLIPKLLKDSETFFFEPPKNVDTADFSKLPFWIAQSHQELDRSETFEKLVACLKTVL